MLPFIMTLSIWLSALGCAPSIKLFTDAADPLNEMTLSGGGTEKVLVIPIRGIISDNPGKGLIKKPSMVQEVVSQLKLAERDKQIKAVVLKINSPGGTATASDIIYHELMRYKQKSGVKIVAAMMDLAASGGYYIALPSDHIMAHPTTITGSIGVVMLIPKFDGLMEKIGVSVDVQKAGENKDMASPFRQATAEERQILQTVTDKLGSRFYALVDKHRSIGGEMLKRVKTARIFIAEEAESVGLIDDIVYINDALLKAKALAGLPADARVVVYRRTYYANDNVYNASTTQSADMELSLINVDLPGVVDSLETGFYYLWLPGVASP
jgi:protease-4